MIWSAVAGTALPAVSRANLRWYSNLGNLLSTLRYKADAAGFIRGKQASIW